MSYRAQALPGGDWGIAQSLEEQERRTEETLVKIYEVMVKTGMIEKERFNELVYQTGVRRKFN